MSHRDILARAREYVANAPFPDKHKNAKLLQDIDAALATPFQGNPNHAVTQKISDQWHKIALLLLIKYDLGHVTLTVDDLAKIPPGSNIVAADLADGLHIYVVDEQTARELAQREGGLPT